MPKYQVVAYRAGLPKVQRSSRTFEAASVEVAIDAVLAERDDNGELVFSEVQEVWERVRHTEVKRELR